MRRRVLLCLTLITMSACNGHDATQPGQAPGSSPNRTISDGNNSNGNRDFFFLPPMVKNPSGTAFWDAGAFNGALHPVVDICDLSATTEAGAAAAACHVTTSYAAALSGSEQYGYEWKVPTDASVTFYRIAVRVGTKQLGFADVETGANGSQLKNVTTGEFVPLVDGRTLPIKFRIERYALCQSAAEPNPPCASQAVDLGTGGTVSTVLPGTTEPTGIVIPAQGTGTPTVTVTVQGCTNLNPRATD